jgi:hypothetical protein
MSKTICGFMAAGLLAVSLPILATTTIGVRAAPASGASHDSAIDTPASESTDFSAARMGGGGGRGGGGGGFRGGGGGGGFRGGGGGGFRGGGGGGFRGGGGGRGGMSSRGGGGRGGMSTRGGGRGGMGGRGGTTRTGTTRTGTTRTGTTHTGTTRTGTTRTGTTRTGTTRTGTTRTGTTRTGTTRTGTTRTGSHTGTHTGTTRTGTTRTGSHTGTHTGTTRVGSTRVGSTRSGTTSIRNRRISTFTGRRFWWRGGWRVLIGITLLTGFAVGPDFYYPEGYIALAEPVCTGYTDDGCALRWQDVAADDGSTIPQCVEFCPRVRRPVAASAAPPVAAAPRGGCEVEVFKDPNLAGGSFRTGEDQPLLNEDWDKKIASINVISGTWDFTTEQQYNGDAMRLTPGTYRDLGPNWVDQISSFMCAQ